LASGKGGSRGNLLAMYSLETGAQTGLDAKMKEQPGSLPPIQPATDATGPPDLSSRLALWRRCCNSRIASHLLEVSAPPSHLVWMQRNSLTLAFQPLVPAGLQASPQVFNIAHGFSKKQGLAAVLPLRLTAPHPLERLSGPPWKALDARCR